MNLFRLTALAAAVFLFVQPATAQWQVPNHSVPVGRGGGITGFGNAAPGTAGIPYVSQGPISDPSFAPVQNNGIAPGAANTTKGSLNGTTTSDIALVSCTLAYQLTQWISGTGWQCGINPVLPSRAVALTLNLTAFAGVRTLGWSAAGDGGDATLTNVGTVPFTDTSIATGNITAAGSGCTNATYFGVQLSGGTGVLAEATVIAAAGAVTSVTLTGIEPGYSASDVLTGTITGCTFTWTATGISPPTGSFIDTAGNHFQIVMPGAGIDARAFGVRFDWNSTAGDAGATDNFTTLTNAYAFAGLEVGGIFARGGSQGGKVLLTRGTAMYCGSSGAKALQQPYGVTVQGQGDFASILKPCDAWGTSTNMYELCNSQSHLACFFTLFEDAQIYVPIAHDTGQNVSTLAVVYSNNIQQESAGLKNAAIFTGACRQGYKLETGFGGASMVTAADGVSLIGGVANAGCSGNASPMMSVNYGTTQVTIDKLTLSALSGSFGGPKVNGLVINGGFVEVHAITSENVTTPLTVNIAGGLANGMVWLQGFEGDQGCVWFATIPNTNTPGNFAVAGPMAVNSCTGGLVQNGQSGGSSMTTPQVLPKNFNP